MQLSAARAFLLDLLGRRDNDATYPPASLNRFINMAQEMVWRELTSINIDLVTMAEQVTYTPGAYFTLPVALTYEVDSIAAIFQTPASGAITASNRGTPILPMDARDIEGHSTWPALVGSEADFRYAYYPGGTLLLRPVPTANVYLTIHYVPVPSELTLDADQIFFDSRARYHTLVVLKAAVLASLKTRAGGLHQQEYERSIRQLESTNSQSQYQMGAGMRYPYAGD